MYDERNARLRAAMADAGVDALVLLVNGNVSYATGATWPLGDAGRANVERPVAVVVAGDPMPAPVRPAARRTARPNSSSIATTCMIRCTSSSTRASRSSRRSSPTWCRRQRALAVDDLTAAMHRGRELLFREWPPRAASDVIGAARLVKTPDELASIRHSLWITEQAMAEVQAHLAPGQRQTDLTALFIRRIFELGAEANGLDPIWQVMPTGAAELPWTVHGDIPCPLLTTERELADGDVLWVDTGILYGGYHSDFGRTWVVGQEPSARQQEQYHRWREISDAVDERDARGRHRRAT